MTSNISYFKFIKADIRQRGWLTALTAVLLFLLMPVFTLFTLDGIKASATPNGGTGSFSDMASGIFVNMLNGSSGPLVIVIALLGLLCAVTGFSYLHSKEKQDFYHGMPLKKPQWFAISYTSGILIFIVPYIVFGICTMLIGQINGLMSQKLFIECLAALLIGILEFLICYHTAILAMFLTGQLVTGVLAFLVLAVYGTVITALYYGIAGRFFGTWSPDSPGILRGIWHYSSPAAMYIDINIHSSLFALVCTVLYIIFVLACSILLSRYFPAEAAERAIAFPKSAPVIKILIAIPTALFAGLFAVSLNSGTGNVWLIFFSILMAVLLCLIIEFIYHRDLRQLLSGRISSFVSVCGVLIILCILQFDLLGYNSYLPKESKLTDMSVYCDNFSGYFAYPESYYPVSYDQMNAPNAAIKDYAPLYQLAQEGIEDAKQGITPSSVRLGGHEEKVSITIRYGLSGKKNVYRKYAVDRTKLLDVMKQLCEKESYRKELFPVFHLDRKEILQLSAQDIYQQPVKLPLTKEQQNRLLDAYEKDVLHVNIDTLQNESPLGELMADLPDKRPYASEITGENGPGIVRLGQLYVYSSYKNTLDLLKRYGYTFRTEINPKDVAQMTYYPNEGTENDGHNDKFGDSIPVTDPGKMDKILSRISYNDNGGLLGKDSGQQKSVEITLINGSYPNSYTFPK